MHSKVTKGVSVLMASDTMPGSPFHAGTNFSIAIMCESVEGIDRIFAALSEGGKATIAVADQFWGARFGMLTDRFGIHWMMNYDYPKP
jgi:PhnB protein